MKKLIDQGLADARRILTEKRKDWETLAEGLLEYETLTGQEIIDLLNGKPPSRPEEDSTPPPSAPTSAVPVTDEEEGPQTGPEPQGA